MRLTTVAPPAHPPAPVWSGILACMRLCMVAMWLLCVFAGNQLPRLTHTDAQVLAEYPTIDWHNAPGYVLQSKTPQHTVSYPSRDTKR